MATGTLGTTSTTALTAVAYSPSPNVLLPADMASIQQGIIDDLDAVATGGGVLTTGDTHTSTTLDTIASMTRIAAGMYVLGVGIPPGTIATAVNVGGSAVTLSQAATASAASVDLIFVPQTYPDAFAFNGLLFIPRRGVLQVLPGDVVAIDNTGWPILVSANSIAYAGSLWNKA